MIMALVFSEDDRVHADEADSGFTGGERLQPAAVVLMVLLVALLIAGTLKVGILLDSYASVTVPTMGWTCSKRRCTG